MWAKGLGIELKDDEVSAVVSKVKSRAIAQKRALTEAEFREIVASVKGKK